MEWFEPGSKIPDENIIDESIAGQLTKTSIVVVATPDKLQDVYRCETKFRAPDAPDEGYAGNAPVYTNTFQADPLDIHWGPKDVKVTPEGDRYYPKEIITCSGQSRPAVDYFIWTDLSNNDTILQEGADKAVLTIHEGWVDEQKTLRCTVRNTMRDGMVEVEGDAIEFGVYTTTLPPTTTTIPTTTLVPDSSTVTDPTTVTPTDAPPLATGAIIGIAVGVVGVIIVVLLLVYCLVIRRNKTSKEQEANNIRPPKPIPADQVRRPDPIDVEKNNLTPGPYDTTPPPAYDNADGYGMQQSPNRNVEGLVYADLALDDTPRSRKPIQFPMDQDPTLYADIRPPGPMV